MLARFSKLFVTNFKFKVDINRILLKKCLQTSAVSCAIKTGGEELKYNYHVVQNYYPEIGCKQNENCLAVESENLDKKSAVELLQIFKTLSYKCVETGSHLAEEVHDDLVQNLLRVMSDFDDDQLAEFMKDMARFPSTPSPRSRNFLDLWSTIDVLCYNRSLGPTWDVVKLLQFCFFFVQLDLARLTDFPRKAVSKIFRRANRLLAKELVLASFFLTITRSKLPMVQVEMKFAQHIDKLSINEIAIIGLAFFKTETKIQNDALIEKIYKKLIKEIGTIEDIPLVNILKVLRYSSNPAHDDFLIELNEAILPHIDRFGLIANLHIALNGTILQYCHQELFEKVIVKFNANLKEARLKDIERITFAMGLFDFKSASGIEKELQRNIVEELKLRVDENLSHPKSFSAVVYFLTLCGQPEPEFIKTVLRNEFVTFAYGKNLMKVGLEMLSLDSYALINLSSSYDGPFLSEKMRANISKYQSHYIPHREQKYKLTQADSQLLYMKEMLETEYGENKIVHVLPHYQRPDIIYCFNKQGKPVTKDLLSCFPEHYRGIILSKQLLFSKHPEFSTNIDDYRMIAVLIGGWNFFFRNTRTPTGHLKLKLEQLKMVGYTPILIHWKDWSKFSESDKMKLLKTKMNEALES